MGLYFGKQIGENDSDVLQQTDNIPASESHKVHIHKFYQ